LVRVTVIIPLYNKGRYIERAVRSVLSQSMGDCEIIVIDDGSTDDGASKLARLEDGRLRILHQVNAGPGAARNRGLLEAKAPLVAFLDADDEYMAGYLEKVVGVLEANQNCAMCATAYIEGTDKKVCELPVNASSAPWRLPVDLTAMDTKKLVDTFLTPCVAGRRDVFLKLGGFYSRERCNYGEDTYLWIQVVLQHPVVRIAEPLVHYHSEASELGEGRMGGIPSKPILSDPGPLRQGCPPAYVTLLEKYLAYCALVTARRMLHAGELRHANELIKKFPLMRSFRREYTKLRLLDPLIGAMEPFTPASWRALFKLRWARSGLFNKSTTGEVVEGNPR
jgi:glycosyltransferase involved in cell wall biosynthesis